MTPFEPSCQSFPIGNRPLGPPTLPTVLGCGRWNLSSSHPSRSHAMARRCSFPPETDIRLAHPSTPPRVPHTFCTTRRRQHLPACQPSSGPNTKPFSRVQAMSIHSPVSHHDPTPSRSRHVVGVSVGLDGYPRFAISNPSFNAASANGLQTWRPSASRPRGHHGR